MKIRELLEAEFQTNRREFNSENSYDVDAQRKRHRRRSNDPMTNLKSGAFGKVYKTNERPHEIIKVPHVANEDDAYYSFIDYVVKSGIAKQNPHFPRVYDIDKWTDAYGRFKYKIKLEILTHYEEVEPEILESMLERYCQLTDSHDPFYTLCEVIRKAITSKDYSHLKDDKLIEACDFVGRFLDRNENYRADIHGGNMMIRLVPYPQLVFVDPVS